MDRHGTWHLPAQRLIDPCAAIAAKQPLAIAAAARQAGEYRAGRCWQHDPDPDTWRLLQRWLGDLSPLMGTDPAVEELADLVGMAAEWFEACGLASAAHQLIARLSQLELHRR